MSSRSKASTRPDVDEAILFAGGGLGIAVALVALSMAAVNIKDYFWFKEGVSLTISDEHKPGIYRNIRDILSPGKSGLALVGAMGASRLLYRAWKEGALLGMVRHPREYRWSSYGANAEGKSDRLLSAHEQYLGLWGETTHRAGQPREVMSDVPTAIQRMVSFCSLGVKSRTITPSTARKPRGTSSPRLRGSPLR